MHWLPVAGCLDALPGAHRRVQRPHAGLARVPPCPPVQIWIWALNLGFDKWYSFPSSHSRVPPTPHDASAGILPQISIGVTAMHTAWDCNYQQPPLCMPVRAETLLQPRAAGLDASEWTTVYEQLLASLQQTQDLALGSMFRVQTYPKPRILVAQKPRD